MQKLAFVLSTFTLGVGSLFAQTPTIAVGGVLPAATYTPAGLPSGVIAEGSFFTIFGSNLGPATGVAAPLPFPTTLSGTSVAVAINGTTVQALVNFTVAGQINAVLPSATPVGTGTVTVSYNNQPSATAPITVVASNFGEFTQNSGGTGPIAAQNFSQNYALTTLQTTAKPGDVEIIYGTGLGPNPGGDQDATTGVVPQSDLRGSLDLHVYLGTLDVTSGVSYAGRTSFVGLDQINLTIPSNAPTGCFVPVIVRIGSVVSNTGSISIDANGATCSDPYGLTSTQISQAASGQLSVASILLTRLELAISSATITEDNAVARFYEFNGTNYSTSPLHNADFITLSSFGSCQITSCANTSTCVPSAKSLSLPHLDAGTSLQISGNGAPTTTISQDTTSGDPNYGFYTANLASNPFALPGFPSTPSNFLQPGTFTVTGSGGADIGAFSASVTVASPVALSTSPSVAPSGGATAGTLNRSQDLTFNLTGAGSSDYYIVSVSSATNVGTQPSGQYNAATITCLPPASATSFTIPSYLLQALPPSSTVGLNVGVTLNLPGGAALAGIYNVSNTFSSNANVSLANSIVLNGTNVNVQ